MITPCGVHLSRMYSAAIIHEYLQFYWPDLWVQWLFVGGPCGVLHQIKVETMVVAGGDSSGLVIAWPGSCR